MTTIIRVKRHRQDDPVEAIVLACKRRKTEEQAEDSETFKTILNFSGTVEEKDDKTAATKVVSLIATPESVKIHKPDLTARNRIERKARTEDSRFKIMSDLRSMNVSEVLDSTEGEESNKSLKILDVSVQKEQDSVQEANEDDSYVYDLYSTYFENDQDFNDLYLDNLVSVQPLACDLDYRNPEDYYEDDCDPDEDDSNDENNWRNDYPDSDHSIDEDDMRLAAQLKGFGIDDGCDLSSNSDDERYLNYDDDGYCHALTAEDLGGERYAKYKAAVLRELNDSDEEDEESY